VRWIAALALLFTVSLFAPPTAVARGSIPSGAEPPWPAVGSARPSSGSPAGGTEVTIIGFNFQEGATVLFGNSNATVVRREAPGQLVVIAPPHSPGRVSVTVTNPDGRRGTRGWTYRYAQP
jgi:hypothetical protein